jgi:hydroxyacylglutathione hydrolase
MEISTITTPFILRVTVNCYLVKIDERFILIDTGRGGKRAAIEKALERAGCRRGDLQLIILTHGDFDHSGNAAYLREKFDTKIAMHHADMGMVEKGDMTWNRKKPNVVVGALFGLLIRLGEADRFTADVTLEEGDDLSEFGLDATVIELPGHSKGSIGILTSVGHLFCGDLLGNLKKPELWSIIDDPVAAAASLEKVKGLRIETLFPGHGKPFAKGELHFPEPLTQIERE